MRAKRIISGGLITGTAITSSIILVKKKQVNHKKRTNKVAVEVLNKIYVNYGKRFLDVLFSGLAIIVLSPVLIGTAIVIVVEDPGPFFFKQKRVGKNMNDFNVLKFRSMCVNAEKYQKVGKEVIGEDSRITRVGYPIRRFKIDELPQLINILKGDMSIIGPRPSLPDYLDEYESWELERFKVSPGLSGLAQVNGNIYLSREEKSKYDVMYVKHLSFPLDVKILLKTFLVIIFGEEKFKK